MIRMKKLYLQSILTLTTVALIYSCSSEEEDTSPPPSVVATPKPEPAPEPPAPTQYTLTVTAGEEGTVSTEGGTYDEGTEITISAFGNSCYEFFQWSDGSTSNERVITLNQNLNLTAEFQENNLTTNISLVELKHPCGVVHAETGNLTFELNAEYNETEKYVAQNTSWLSLKLDETHQDYYYPTSNDYNEPGNFTLSPHNFALSDFNKDGLQDVIITWATFTHTLERESRFTYTFLINNGDGSLSFEEDYIISPSIHNQHFAYRTIAADFNNDGIDDVVSSSMGLITRNPDGTKTRRWESIPLLLSNGIGNYYDATRNIEGQEDGISPPDGHTFGHELSVGDVDGDGDNDIYTGKILLINDGTGNFTNETSNLPNELKPLRPIFSSVIADFNNDGIDDFFVPYGKKHSDYFDFKSYSGAYSISNDGTNSYQNSLIGYVTEAKYGLQNTNFNDAIAYDINLDGYKDIVLGVTRESPYYEGKALQVFLNVEDLDNESRKFEPADYLITSDVALDTEHGEGSLSVLDVNNDGILDIIHSSEAYGNEMGLTFYINQSGTLNQYDRSNFAYLTKHQIDEKRSASNKLKKAIPINLDNQGWIDYISFVSDKTRLIMYSVMSKE